MAHRRRCSSSILAAAGGCLLLLGLLLRLDGGHAFQLPPSSIRSSARSRGSLRMSAADAPLNPDHDILLRVARGERTHRTPVWLMRQVRLWGVPGWME